MKGIVFTAFCELVAARFGLQTLDSIIERSGLETDGAYTAVGTYDHRELVRLVQSLADLTGTGERELQRLFGHHLFGLLFAKYAQLFAGKHDADAVLLSIDDYIHPEVLKLYPDAELPSFEHERSPDGSIHLTYRSKRPFAAFAEGLIQGCLDHFDDERAVRSSQVQDGSGGHVFTVA